MQIVVYKPERQNSDYPSTRYAIADDNGAILDDAQGWGYTSREKANKAMWYKFNGGKAKIASGRNKKKMFFKQHPEIKSFINEFYEINFKEIATGEVTKKDFIEAVKDKFKIKVPSSYLNLD